jgi:hypothetical protein
VNTGGTHHVAVSSRRSAAVTIGVVAALVGLSVIAFAAIGFIQKDLRSGGQCEGWHVCTQRLHHTITILRVVIVVNVAAIVAAVAATWSERFRPKRSVILRGIVVLIVFELVAAVPIGVYAYGKPG